LPELAPDPEHRLNALALLAYDDDLRSDRRVRLSGVSLSASEISAGDIVEAYVDERDVDDLVDDYLLDRASPRQSNVVLHVVPDDVHDLAAYVPTDLWLLVSADLNEHSGPREFAQALRLLDGLEELDSSGRLSRYGSSGRG